jgi:hypothetical protein
MVAASVFVVCAVGCAASTRFDMGGPTTPLAAGYTRVTATDIYTAEKGFGWARPGSYYLFRSEPTNPYLAQGPQGLEFALLSDAVLSIEENTFTFHVAPGRYAVTAIIGDLALGEGRPGQSVWANGERVVDMISTDASVKAFTFPVNAPESKIELRFRSDSSQKYVTVEAVSAEPLAAGQECRPSMKEYPEGPVPLETYRANWKTLEEALLADWEQAKRELAAEGVDLSYWQKEAARLKGQAGYRPYWGWTLGSGAWERLAQKTSGLDLGRILAAFKAMGIDGFGSNSPSVAQQIRAAGMGHSVAGHAEALAGGDYANVTLNLMKNADGSTQTIEKVWSTLAPEARAAFTKLWNETPGKVAEGAEYFLVDEPRGMWGAGRFGDYSAPAQAEFSKWCEAKGYRDLVGKPIPERGRNMAFYRFYQFRLQSVAMFMKAATAGTPVAQIPLAPGNGDVGPEQMNHNCLWPPAVAQAGMITACWAYHNPASCKMYAETIGMAREYGGQSIIVPPQYPEAHTWLQDRPMGTACISALNDRVMPWHFRGPTDGPERVAWMKNVFYGARTTHATSGLKHTPPLYVYLPESLVYNDLIEFNEAEKGNWSKVYNALFEANLDYGVTNTLAVPPGSVVLYACVKPVLSAEEFARVQEFMSKGGVLLCAFAGTPELPDGTPLADWARLRTTPTTLEPFLLRKALQLLQRPMNMQTDQAAVKTYRYVTAGGGVAHLLNNTSLEQAATVKISTPLVDMFSGKSTGATVTIAPGMCVLLSRSQ